MKHSTANEFFGADSGDSLPCSVYNSQGTTSYVTQQPPISWNCVDAQDKNLITAESDKL